MGMGSTATRVRMPTATTAAADQGPREMARVSYTISAAGSTDRGQRRAENEDCILCETSASGGMGLFAVADGMGGQRSGEVASAITIATLRERLLPLLDESPTIDPRDAESHGVEGLPPLTDAVGTAIRQCNERVVRHSSAHADAQGLGSTVTLALIKGSLAVIGNVGDSRTYRIRDGAIERLTNDHSLVAHLAAIGQIAPDDVYTHPHRSYIYRALGADPEIQPDIVTERLRNGDILLLCSDGLWEMVRDEAMREAIDPQARAEDIADRLVRLANANGGDDNISVIVIKVNEP